MQADTDSSEPADAAVAFARRLLDRERSGDDSDAALTRALERSCELITTGLSRWFGQYGSRALVTRALAMAQKDHPALAGVGVSGSHCLVGVSASVEVHGSADVTEGIVVTVAALARLLGRLIGDNLAISLLEQSTTPDATNGLAAPAPEAHDHPTTKVKRDE